jgi:hypothetical protein
LEREFSNSRFVTWKEFRMAGVLRGTDLTDENIPKWKKVQGRGAKMGPEAWESTRRVSGAGQ